MFRVPHEQATGGLRLPRPAPRADALRAVRHSVARDGADVHEDHGMATDAHRLLARVAGADFQRRPSEVLRARPPVADLRGDPHQRRRGEGPARRRHRPAPAGASGDLRLPRATPRRQAPDRRAAAGRASNRRARAAGNAADRVQPRRQHRQVHGEGPWAAS